MGKLEIKDIHLSVSSEGAYGAISTLNFMVVNTGVLPSIARIHVLFEGTDGARDTKSWMDFIPGRGEKHYTVDEYIPVVKARVTVYRLLRLRPDDVEEVHPT